MEEFIIETHYTRNMAEAAENRNQTERRLGTAKIADELGRHVSTIYREKKRGLGIQCTTDLIDYECYIPKIAQAKYEENFSNKGPDLKRGKDHEYANHLGEALKNGERSPQAAQGLKFETKISVRTLYRYIDMGFIPSVSDKDLPIKRSKDKKKKTGKPRAARNCKGKSIEERPKKVDDRETPGHWEMDTVVSKKGGSPARVLSITERMTRWQINVKIKTGETKSVIAVFDKLEKKLGEKFSFVFKTITVDNGSEFADVDGMEQSCLDGEKKRLTIYHCHPYCSSERGSN